MTDPQEQDPLDDYTDQELIEALLLRAGEVDSDDERSQRMMAEAITAASGDESTALQVLEQKRTALGDQVLAFIDSLQDEAPSIYAHEMLLEKLEPSQ